MWKKIVSLFAFLLIPYYIYAQGNHTNEVHGWDEATYRVIEDAICAPSFPERTFPITRFGAKTNASAKVNQKAINKAIAACSKAGGGKVVIPEGVWMTGAIRMQSNVNLVIEKGATLQFAYEPDLYPLVRTRWEGLDIMNYSPCIYAFQARNIAVTGRGTINGGGKNETWWQWCGAAKYGFEKGKTPQAQNMPYAGDTLKFDARDKDGQRLTNRNMLLWMADHNIPTEERIFGKGCGMRPQLVNFYECEGILLEDVTLLNSPFWTFTPTLSKNITVRRCKFINNGPNGDGCNPESCENVLIEDCLFHTGDDCIAIKSGRNGDGRRHPVPSKNIIVRGCTMEDGHGGVVLGSEISGGVQDVFAENCTMDSPNLERVLRIKTNTCRGGVTDGVYMRNIQIGQCREAVLRINLLYEPKEQAERGFIPIVKNVYMENVTCKKSRYGILLNGLEDTQNIVNVHLKNCDFSGITDKTLNLNNGYSNIKLDNVKLNGEIVNNTYSSGSYSNMLNVYGIDLQSERSNSLKTSERMVLSEIQRTQFPFYLDFTDTKKRPEGKWSYVMGIELEAMLDVYLAYGNKAIIDYISLYAPKMIKQDGSITGYKQSDYNLDNVRTGRFIHRMNQLFPSQEREGTKKAVSTLFEQLEQQPRTKEGVWWHKEIYHDQVWLDGIYMGLPFYTMVARDTKPTKSYYDDAVAQISKTFKRTYDKKTGLWKHAWDEKHSMFWADKKTGQSQHTWARAMGWFTMAMIEVLDVLPEDYAKRKDVIKMFQQTMQAVVRYQDEKSHLWFDVLDVKDPRNYLEATASSMFTYCLLKGVRLGYLDDSYQKKGIEAYEAIQKEFVRKEKDGTLSLIRCCSVSGLGPEKSPNRDGSFDYYMSEPIRDNDAKGIGPFIWASLEYEAITSGNTSRKSSDKAKASDNTTLGHSFSPVENQHSHYDFVVPRDGDFRQAIEAANNRKDLAQRFRIFVQKGEHIIPTKGTTIGGDSVTYPDPRTYLTAPNTSIIGEDRDFTVVANITPPVTWHNGFNAACPLEGIGNGDVLIMEKTCKNTYFQDITLKNSMPDKSGRNIALHDRGDLTIYNNICLWGYQDSYVSNNADGRYYFKGGVLRGRTDYICGKGDVYFDHVTFQQCDKAGYIAAPSIPRKYGYVMQQCYIKNETPDVTYYLGRPWGKGTPTAIWINTTVDSSPITKDKKGYNGWADMGSKGWPARFAEYGTMLNMRQDSLASSHQGKKLLDLTGRRSSYMDNDGVSHPNNAILTHQEAETYTLERVLDGWNASADAKLLPPPECIFLEKRQLKWNVCPGALLYAVCHNGCVFEFTTNNHYTIPDSEQNGTWSIRVANQMGGLGKPSMTIKAL